jgi:hypothetical protein
MRESTNLNPSLKDTRIPHEVRLYRQWVGWTYEQKPGKAKPNKKPINPHTGQGADTTDPETWGTFEDAVRIKEEKGLAGVGFVFSPAYEIVGFDLDDCVDPNTGKIEPWAREVVRALDSYTEFSPSRTGLHVHVRGKLPITYEHPDGIGIYSGGGYMTITGDTLFPGKGIEGRQKELEKLYREHFRKNQNRAPASETPPAEPSMLDDEEIVELACSSKAGPNFTALYDHGETNRYLKDGGTPGDRSRAHFGLLGHLTFYTHDPEQLERLMDASAFGKCERWRDEPNYRHRTINQAIVKARGKPSYRRRNRNASPEVKEMARRMDWLAANQPWSGRNGARNYRILQAFITTGGEQGKGHPLGGFITSNSVEYLAYRASMTKPNSILAGVGELEELGWIRVLKRGRDEYTPNTYWVKVPAQLDNSFKQAPPVYETLIHLRVSLSKVRNNGIGAPGGCFKVRRRSGKRTVTYSVEYPPKPPLVKGSIGIRGSLIVEKVLLAGWRVGAKELLKSIDPDANNSKFRDFMRREIPPIVDAGLLFLDPDTGEVCAPLGVAERLKKHLEETGSMLVSKLQAKALGGPDDAPTDAELEAKREHTKEIVELRKAEDKMHAAGELGVEWYREKDGSVTVCLPLQAKEEVSA